MVKPPYPSAHIEECGSLSRFGSPRYLRKSAGIFDRASYCVGPEHKTSLEILRLGTLCLPAMRKRMDQNSALPAEWGFNDVMCCVLFHHCSVHVRPTQRSGERGWMLWNFVVLHVTHPFRIDFKMRLLFALTIPAITSGFSISLIYSEVR